MAMALIHRFLQHGVRVPEDIAVVGFDDMPYAMYSQVPLTTIAILSGKWVSAQRESSSRGCIAEQAARAKLSYVLARPSGIMSMTGSLGVASRRLRMQKIGVDVGGNFTDIVRFRFAPRFHHFQGSLALPRITVKQYSPARGPHQNQGPQCDRGCLRGPRFYRRD